MALDARLRAIRAVCLDVDGVLTDGRLYIDDTGRGARLFDVHDGFALYWYQRLGGIVVICSGKHSEAVAVRAAELGITHVVQGSRDKPADLAPRLAEIGLGWSELAVIGDDLPDVPLLHRCGFPIAVANAVDEVKAVAQLVTRRAGGRGAVREALEHLMRATGRWAEVQAHYGLARTARPD